MRIDEFCQSLQRLGAKQAHIDRILRAWLQAKPLDAGSRRQAAENFLPLQVRAALPDLSLRLDKLARVLSEHPGEEGARLLVELADGQTVESVLLPRDGDALVTIKLAGRRQRNARQSGTDAGRGSRKVSQCRRRFSR